MNTHRNNNSATAGTMAEETFESKNARFEQLLSSGKMTPNQVRIELGLPPIADKNGDKLFKKLDLKIS